MELNLFFEEKSMCPQDELPLINLDAVKPFYPSGLNSPFYVRGSTKRIYLQNYLNKYKK